MTAPAPVIAAQLHRATRQGTRLKVWWLRASELRVYRVIEAYYTGL